MILEKLQEKFTKYEIARILGARSLQLAMDAPVLLKLSKEEEDKLNYDSLKIAEKELESGVLPITVRRPLPKKSEKTVKNGLLPSGIIISELFSIISSQPFINSKLTLCFPA